MSLHTNLRDAVVRMSTEAKSLRTLLNGNQADNSALTTNAKSNLVAAINEVRTLALAGGGSGGSGSPIDDTSPSYAKVYSSQKVVDLLAALKTELYGPDVSAALDTFREIGDAIGQNGNAIAALNGAIANRVRFDAGQVLTSGQKDQARANIGAVSTDAIGNTDYNYVYLFESGLV